MRVLQVVHDFVPTSVAGVEVYTLELAHALQRRGHAVVVAHPVRGPGLSQYALRRRTVEGLPVYQMVQNYPYRPLSASTVDVQAERRFREILEREEPDVVHVQHLWGWSASVPRMARDAGVPVVMHLHDHWLACPSGGQRYHPERTVCEEIDHARCDGCYARFQARAGPLERLALRAASNVPPRVSPDLFHRTFLALPRPVRMALKRVNRRAALALPPRRVEQGVARRRRAVLIAELESVGLFLAASRDLAERMVAWGLDANRVLVVPNGTSMSGAGRRPPPRLADAGRPLRLLFLGTPAKHKGVHVLADAVGRVPEPVELVIHGAEPDAGYLARLHIDGDRIRFAGPLARDQVAAAIDDADAVALPSLWPENAPLVLLEARARGRPVLASRVGGVAETAQGVLIPPGDVDAWATAVSRLARDRAALDRLARRVTPPPTIGENARRVLGAYGALG